MKGTRKILFSKHAIKRAEERQLEIKALTKLFRKSSFYRAGYADARVYKKGNYFFVARVFDDFYLVITAYKDNLPIGVIADHPQVSKRI